MSDKEEKECPSHLCPAMPGMLLKSYPNKNFWLTDSGFKLTPYYFVPKKPDNSGYATYYRVQQIFIYKQVGYKNVPFSSLHNSRVQNQLI